MIQALEEAVKVWNAPRDMATMWEQSEIKQRHEKMITDWVDKFDPDIVADLGCGVGRYIDLLTPNLIEYYGYDGSSEMLDIAYHFKSNPKKIHLSIADIFNFSSDRNYDAVIMIDVAQHQNDPVGAILRMMDLWNAKRYFVSLIVGDFREDLFASTVVPFTELLNITDVHTIKRMYTERYGVERFAWMLVELTRGLSK